MKRLRVARLGASFAAGCLVLGVVSVPANGAPVHIGYYGLGDSFSSGLGNNDYSYADKLDAKQYIDGDKLAFPGVTAPLVLATQVPAVNEDADLITITVGGTDVDWVGILQACAVSAQSCQAAIAAASVTLATTLPSDLDDLFTAISSKAPGAKVVVLGYPHLFTPDPTDPTTYPVYLAVNAATDQLNAVIEAETVEADGLGGADFQYVDVTKRFAGHGANTTNPWINPYPALSPAAVPLHPNTKGQQAYYAAVRSTGSMT